MKEWIGHPVQDLFTFAQDKPKWQALSAVASIHVLPSMTSTSDEWLAMLWKIYFITFWSSHFLFYLGLLNLRGADIIYNPVFFAYVVVTSNAVQ